MAKLDHALNHHLDVFEPDYPPELFAETARFAKWRLESNGLPVTEQSHFEEVVRWLPGMRADTQELVRANLGILVRVAEAQRELELPDDLLDDVIRL